MASKETQPVITMFRGWLDHGRFVWSPFVTKLETRLRFAGVPYKTEAGSPKQAPRGKIPYIDYRAPASSETEQFGDSALIIKRLIADGVLPDLNAKLSPSAQNHDLALKSLFEDRLCFYHARERWLDNYYTMRDHVLWSLPYPIRIIVGNIIYRSQVSMLHAQGTGRFTDAEIAAFKTDIWSSIDTMLAASQAQAENDGPFWVLGGDAPTEADCVVFAFIVSVLLSTAGPESQRIVKGFPTLITYAERIHETYFSDYAKW